MAQRALRPCKETGCPELTRSAAGYCDAHIGMAEERRRESWRADAERRGSARERGYDSAWEKVRLQKLRLNPLCEDCEERGDIAPATEVHHIEKVRDRPDLRLALGNLRSLCRACHEKRTARGE